MRDLEIWRRLRAGAATAADIDAVAALPLARRAAYLDAIAPLVASADAATRAAAMRALCGAAGMLGLRPIVAALADDDAAVRAAALAALLEVARDAPARIVHALFHPDAGVRRAAIAAELPRSSRDYAIYLRADPDPDVAALAAHQPWPARSIALALDLQARGALAADELVQLIVREPPSDVRRVLAEERRRDASALASLVDRACASGFAEVRAAPAADLLDDLAMALAAGERTPAVIDHVVELVTPVDAELKLLPRRAAIALLRTGHSDHAVIACALEPRLVASPDFDPAWVGALAARMIRHHWPVRPAPAAVQRLLALPLAARDLRLAAALVGLLPGRRLKALAKAWTDEAIVAALCASDTGDAGWTAICALPQEQPPREQKWLAAVQAVDYKRYIALAGRAIAGFGGKRLDAFLEQLPRRHRLPAFTAAIDHVTGHATGHATGAARADLDELCRAIAPRADRATLQGLLEHALGLASPAAPAAIVRALVRAAPDKHLAVAVAGLSPAHAAQLVAALDDPDDPPPRDRELAVSTGLVRCAHPAVAAWRAKVATVAPVAAPTPPPPPPPSVRRLSPREADAIATCSAHDLARMLAPALEAPALGLVAALARRDQPSPSIAACAALLGCADPLAAAAELLDRFTAPTPRFDADLDDACTCWARAPNPSVLASARLYRWEAHTFAVARWIDDRGGPLAALAFADALPGRLAAQTLWRGVAETFSFLRYRDRSRYQRDASPELAHLAAGRIDSDVGRHAARILVALIEGGAIAAASVRDAVLDRVGDADPATRELVGRIVRFDGQPAAIERPAPLAAATLLAIRGERDIPALLAHCRAPHPAIVEEAALALAALGANGQAALAALLAELATLPVPLPILATIQLWDEPAALARARALAGDPALPPAWQFHVAIGLAARRKDDGDADANAALATAIAALRAPPSTARGHDWHPRRDDWDSVERLAGTTRAAIALADAPHHHIYTRAVRALLDTPPVHEIAGDIAGALRAFLEVDDLRPSHLRRAAAHRLAERGDLTGAPILAEAFIDTGADGYAIPPRGAGGLIAELAVGAALVGGEHACPEKRATALVKLARPELPDLGAALDARMLLEAQTAAARVAATSGGNYERLARVAEVFAWGVRRGVELTGRHLHIHGIARERHLGHTKLDDSHIFVSALPLLRGEPHGQDVVEGLILHEIGHHVYHRAPAAQALWQRAHKEGVGHLLNLVADEHLERNLRAVDRGYGDRLKRLGAYAFQHAPQELRVDVLLGCLRGSAARALIATPLDVAYDDHAVRLRRGAVLAALDRDGHPLARFARALRMGLGNRTGDPRVAAALALVADVREFDMQRLYDVTWQLARLFGGAIEVAKVFGGPEGLGFGKRDEDVFGVDDDALQKEIERVLDPKQRERRKGPPRGPLWINVAPEHEFPPLTRVERLRADPAVHRAVAIDVARHSSRLRAFLDELGMRFTTVHARTQGRALDRTRLIPLVTRGDPRILVARAPRRHNDLFLGVLVDCSGSMSVGGNLDRARRFAILVAEAVRPLPGVDARFFGFTDTEIFDAGDAHDCAVSALETSGGNNDAGALLHAANLALASRARARVLVMISDGLPTSCSAGALRSFVTYLTRRKQLVCAQVAVRPLVEVCFPHYVVLDGPLEPAVAKFGRMVAELVSRSLAS